MHLIVQERSIDTKFVVSNVMFLKNKLFEKDSRKRDWNEYANCVVFVIKLFFVFVLHRLPYTKSAVSKKNDLWKYWMCLFGLRCLTVLVCELISYECFFLLSFFGENEFSSFNGWPLKVNWLYIIQIYVFVSKYQDLATKTDPFDGIKCSSYRSPKIENML